MKTKKIIIFTEGGNEENFILDWTTNHGSFKIKWDVLDNSQDANRVDSVVLQFGETHDVYFVLDYDEPDTVLKIDDAIETAEKNSTFFKPIIQDPSFEVFEAACFEEFIIEDHEWNDKITLRERAKAFLKTKSNINVKRWTYTEIVSCGGHIKHSGRYRKKFGIFEELELNTL